MASANTGLMATAVMIVVPQFTLIHPYLHLLIVAPLLVFTGCQRALAESAKGSDSQVITHIPVPGCAPTCLELSCS